jgi:protein NirF
MGSISAWSADEPACEVRGTGDLGLVVERARGSLQLIETSGNRALGRIEGLGDLSHASLVFSRDERYAYVFGRDGGLSKVDLLCRRLVKRLVQAGNSIGGAISQDGRLVAVSNYEPGGVRVFDAATLEQIADLPAEYGDGKRSKVVGLTDAPGQRFVYSLWDAAEIRVADFSDPAKPQVRRFENIGRQPYDALLSADGRYYLAGLFGEDGLALLDLWDLDAGVKRILPDYGQGDQKLPVYKMPHLEGWSTAGTKALVPAVGRHELLVIDTQTWQPAGKVPVLGQPVFVRVRPDGRQAWVNFAFPDNGKVQVIDTRNLQVIKTLEPGPGVLHLEFEPRGEEVWLSVRDADRVQVYDTATFSLKAELAADKPSGIFLTPRAHQLGW